MESVPDPSMQEDRWDIGTPCRAELQMIRRSHQVYRLHLLPSHGKTEFMQRRSRVLNLLPV